MLVLFLFFHTSGKETYVLEIDFLQCGCKWQAAQGPHDAHCFLSMWTTTGLLQTTCGINSSLEHCLHCLVITINLENHQQIVLDIVVATLPSWSAASAGYEHATAKSRGNNSNKSDLKKRRNESNKDKPLLTETNYFQLLWFYFWTGIIKVYLLAT